jgi:hypothetical protein
MSFTRLFQNQPFDILYLCNEKIWTSKYLELQVPSLGKFGCYISILKVYLLAYDGFLDFVQYFPDFGFGSPLHFRKKKNRASSFRVSVTFFFLFNFILLETLQVNVPITVVTSWYRSVVL